MHERHNSWHLALAAFLFVSHAFACSAPVLVDSRNVFNTCDSTTNTVLYNNPGGANTLLIVKIENYNNKQPTLVSYAGVNLTLFRNDAVPLQAPSGQMAVYYMVNPATGNNTLEIDYSTANCFWNVGAQIYSGVDQSSPLGAVTFTQNLTASNSLTNTIGTLSNNSVIDDFLVMDQNTSLTPGSGQLNLNIGGACCDYIGGYFKAVGASGAYSVSYTGSVSTSYASELFEIQGAACVPTQTRTSTASPTVSPTGSPTLTGTHTASPTSSPTCTSTVTNSDTPTVSPTDTLTLTDTPTSTDTDTPTASPTATPTFTSTATDSDTATASPTHTPTLTNTPTSTDTETPTASPTATPSYTSTATDSDTPTVSPSDSPTLTSTPTATGTETPTASPTATPSYTATTTDSDTPTVSPSDSPTLTGTPTATSTQTPTASPTATPSYTATATDSDTPTVSPSDSPTLTSTPTATGTQTPTLTDTLTSTNTGTPTVSPTATLSCTATDSNTLTFSPTGSSTQSDTATPTYTLSPTPSISVSATSTNSPSGTLTPTPTTTMTPTLSMSATTSLTVSNTPSVTTTFTPSPTFSPSVSQSCTPTFSHTPTATASFSATLVQSPTASPSYSASPTISPTYTPPGPIRMTLRIYSDTGRLLRTADGGNSFQAVQIFQFSKNPFDPTQSPLVISGTGWQMTFDGKSDQGEVLRNGEYIVVLQSDDGQSQTTSQQVLFIVGGEATGLEQLIVGPNPASRRTASVMISWQPAVPVIVSIYNLDGELVVSPRQVDHPPLAWNLATASGSGAGNGIYLIQASLPGQKTPIFRKLAVAR